MREPLSTGREVWYRLTDAGRELGPAIDAFTLWGIEHAREPPLPGEPVHPIPVMIGTKVWLNRHADPPTRSVAWVWRFPGDDHYTLRSEGGTWELARGQAEAATVTVQTTPEAWARFLTGPRRSRRLPRTDIQLEAQRAQATKFAKAFAVELGPA